MSEEFKPSQIIEFDELNEEQKNMILEKIPYTWGYASGRGTLFFATIEEMGKNSHRVAIGSRNTHSMSPVVLHTKLGFAVIAPQDYQKIGGNRSASQKAQVLSINDL